MMGNSSGRWLEGAAAYYFLAQGESQSTRSSWGAYKVSTIFCSLAITCVPSPSSTFYSLALGVGASLWPERVDSSAGAVSGISGSGLLALGRRCGMGLSFLSWKSAQHCQPDLLFLLLPLVSEAEDTTSSTSFLFLCKTRPLFEGLL